MQILSSRNLILEIENPDKKLKLFKKTLDDFEEE